MITQITEHSQERRTQSRNLLGW